MRQVLLFFLLLSSFQGLLAQGDNETAPKVIIDQVDETEATGNNQRRVTSQVWKTNPRLAKKKLTYTVVDNDSGEEIDVVDETEAKGSSNRRATEGVVVVTRNSNAADIDIDGTTVSRRNRSEVNGESVDEDTDVMDLTALPPGDYTVRARNKKGKEKAEIQIKIKGKKRYRKGKDNTVDGKRHSY